MITQQQINDAKNAVIRAARNAAYSGNCNCDPGTAAGQCEWCALADALEAYDSMVIAFIGEPAALGASAGEKEGKGERK